MMVTGIGIVAVSLIMGVIWATRVWKKHGTIHFVSRVMATPELDNPEENVDKSKK